MGFERLKEIILDMAKLSEQNATAPPETYSEPANHPETNPTKDELEHLHGEAVELASEMLTRYQPTTSDRRFIKSCMEMAYVFSHSGRHTYDLLRVSAVFSSLPKVNKQEVEEATRQASEMMRLNMQAFINRDDEPATNLARMDEIVDEVYLSLAKKVLQTADSN